MQALLLLASTFVKPFFDGLPSSRVSASDICLISLLPGFKQYYLARTKHERRVKAQDIILLLLFLRI